MESKTCVIIPDSVRCLDYDNESLIFSYEKVRELEFQETPIVVLNGELGAWAWKALRQGAAIEDVRECLGQAGGEKAAQALEDFLSLLAQQGLAARESATTTVALQPIPPGAATGEFSARIEDFATLFPKFSSGKEDLNAVVFCVNGNGCNTQSGTSLCVTI